MTGTVNTDGEAVVSIAVRGPRGSGRKIRAVVDTGYNGWLTLPPDVITRLDLDWLRQGLAVLADGSEITYDVYDGVVVWGGRPRRVFVDTADSTPLVGMAMLAGYELNVQVRPRGKVTIAPLPDEPPRRRRR